MTLRAKRCLFTAYLTDLLLYARQEGLQVAVDTTRRSREEQRRLVDAGASRTMQSKHLDGLAVDLLLYDAQGSYQPTKGPYQPLGTYWCLLDPHNVWGGNWHDPVDAGHFEYVG